MESPDQKIVAALLKRNDAVTRDFFYKKCYPLFKSVYDNYQTDCTSCLEFINAIYIHIMTPDKETGICKLQKFRFESTLFTWLKTVCVFYCYKKYERANRMPTEKISENYEEGAVRLADDSASMDIEDSLSKEDVETILRLMPNKRYSMLIRLRYLDNLSNEETAQALGMNMNTFYNKHKLAKDQFVKVLRKEEDYSYGE